MQYPREGTFALGSLPPHHLSMGIDFFSFRELLTQAAGLVPGLVSDEGKVNLTAVSRYTKSRGHEVSQPTLYRHFNAKPGKQPRMEPETIEALYLVFRIPKGMLRKDAMDAETKEALARYPLSTILLAERIEALPPALRRSVLLHIEELLRREEEHKRASPGPNVTHLPRRPQT